MREEGGAALADALAANQTTLERLVIKWCPIREAAGVRILKALESHTAIQYVNMSACALGDAAGKACIKMVAANPKISTLKMFRNGFGEDTVSAIESAWHGGGRGSGGGGRLVMLPQTLPKGHYVTEEDEMREAESEDGPFLGDPDEADGFGASDDED